MRKEELKANHGGGGNKSSPTQTLKKMGHTGFTISHAWETWLP